MASTNPPSPPQKQRHHDQQQGRRRKRTKEDRERDKELRRLEIRTLTRRIQAEAPKRGYAPPLTQVVAFRALPISEPTLQGLDSAKPVPYTTMTAIQNACIPHALAGRDVLGAAQTGSGKTLAYLIPVLERLYRQSFCPSDGPGAVLLSPTRELAVQIFQVLKQVGKYHCFSVGLLIGGKKDFYDEQQQIATTNLLICTPGRLLQHCEQTPYLDLSAVQMLVLDEADRILDMGFRDQLVRILDYLPSNNNNDSDEQQPSITNLQQPQQQRRQTLLFSATQTRDVKHMATLSLRNPEYLGVHDKEKSSTPEGLQQSYIVVPLKDKLNAVYSFIKSNLKTKSILFFASCAQVRHANELLCSLRPGIPILALHGKLSQTRRTQIYFDFLQRPNAALVATDICARGLDFPNIHWVVQVDAPEDRDMYIHRAGRTARYRSGGKAMLMLTPEEESRGFVDLLLLQKKSQQHQTANQNNNDHGNNPNDAKSALDQAASQTTTSTQIPLQRLRINPSKTVAVSQRAASMVASNVELHQLAKKAFQSYARSIYLMPHKEIFRVQDLDLDGYATSLGLASTPNLQFIKKVSSDRDENRQSKNVNRKLQKLKEQIKADKLAKRIAKLGPKGSEIVGKKENATDDNDVAREEDDDLLVAAKTQKQQVEMDHLSLDGMDAKLFEVSRSRHPKKIRIDGSNSLENKRVVFNEDGEEEDARALLLSVDDEKVRQLIQQDKQELARATDDYMERVRDRLRSNFKQDEEQAKQRVREKHRKRRLQEKSEEADVSTAAATAAPVVTLGDKHVSTVDDKSDGVESTRSDSDSPSSHEQSSAADDSQDDEEGEDVVATRTQEEIALALIRRGG